MILRLFSVVTTNGPSELTELKMDLNLLCR